MPVDLAADTVARVLGHAADHRVAARIHQPLILRRQRFTVRGAFLELVHNGRAARGDALGQDMHRIRFHNAGVHQDMVGVQPRIRPASGLRGGRRTLRGRRHHVGRFRAGDLHAHDLRFLVLSKNTCETRPRFSNTSCVLMMMPALASRPVPAM